MKNPRGLFRLGSLTLLALMLMAAMTLPSSAADICSSQQMLEEVEIISVIAKASPAVWSAKGLVKFDYGGDIENGLLEIRFKDIATDFDFDGYIIEAVSGDDDPGDSRRLGVPDYKSPSLIARPAVVGSTVTEVLNLEPGTKYYVTVHAVNHNTVQISPDQRAQDSRSATTLLSAPFLGAVEFASLTGTVTNGVFAPTITDGVTQSCTPDDTNAATCQFTWWHVRLADDDFKGTHFALYGVRGEAGQHYFRWLKPHQFGPFDHLLDTDGSWTWSAGLELPPGTRDPGEQADMLSLDEDGNVDDHCADKDINGDCGHTHYLFKAVDANGKSVASELVETQGRLGHFTHGGLDYFQVVFAAEPGDLTLSVSLGRMVGGQYKAMSDTASVTFEAPNDLRALDQTYLEYRQVLNDLTGEYDENKDLVQWLGANDTGTGRSIWNRDPERGFSAIEGVSAAYGRNVLQAHLNNQLK